MEQICSCPVKDWHKVIADYLYSKLAQITDTLFIIFDILISGWQTDLDIIMYVNAFYNIHIKKASPENLLVNQLAAKAAEEAAAGEAAAAETTVEPAGEREEQETRQPEEAESDSERSEEQTDGNQN